jgi:hypothetical protein
MSAVPEDAMAVMGENLTTKKLLLSPSLASYDVEIVQISRGDRGRHSGIV